MMLDSTQTRRRTFVPLIFAGIGAALFTLVALLNRANFSPQETRIPATYTGPLPPAKLAPRSVDEHPVSPIQEPSQNSYVATWPKGVSSIDPTGVLVPAVVHHLHLSTQETDALKQSLQDIDAAARKLVLQNFAAVPEKGPGHYVLKPYVTEGAALREQLASTVTQLLGAERATAFVEHYPFASRFGAFGTREVHIAITERTTSDNTVRFRAQVDQYNVITGFQISRLYVAPSALYNRFGLDFKEVEVPE